jgi:hypothetical protein
MDDRRYEVFVSSTFFDLVDERAAVSKVLLEMDAFPSGMELFPATDADSWTLIQQVIDSADYYLLIVGGRYGSIDDTTALSYTEKKYDYAVSKKKPVMAFLHGEPGKIERDKSEMDPLGIEKLDSFRNKVEGAKHVKFWTSKDQLAGQVATSYASFRKVYRAVGWIRGDAETTTESLKELNDLRKQLQELEAERDATRRGPPPGTEDFLQGSEPAELQPAYTWNGDITLDGEDDRARTHIDIAGYVIEGKSTAWDEYFSAIGPLMFVEAAEEALKERIAEWLSSNLRAEGSAGCGRPDKNGRGNVDAHATGNGLARHRRLRNADRSTSCSRPDPEKPTSPRGQRQGDLLVFDPVGR